MFESAEFRCNCWVKDHYRFLMRSAWALTGLRAIAEDVVQDYFASAWNYRDPLRDASLGKAWLFQIMRRHTFRYLAPGGQSFDDGDERLDCTAPDAGLDDQLDVVKALAQIAPISLEVSVLFYFDDMSTAFMAKALDIAPGTVLFQPSRARAALEAAMTPPAMQPPRSATPLTITLVEQA